MKTRKEHPSTTKLSAADRFYSDSNPVNAIQLAIEDHQAFAGGNGQHEFVAQLRVAQYVCERIEELKRALQAGLCVTQLNLNGVAGKWPTGTDTLDGPDFKEIERMLKDALVTLHWR
jgi:hypothetical protein